MWERILFDKCGRSLFVVGRLRCLSFLSALHSICVGIVCVGGPCFSVGGDIVCQTFDYLFIVSSLLLRCFASAFSHRRCLLEVCFILAMGIVFQTEGRRISGAGSFFSVGGEWILFFECGRGYYF